MIWPAKKSVSEELKNSLFEEKGVEVHLLRDDLLHPGISGNKWRKLKYNLIEISERGINKIVTVGGSHSNHIAAVAVAGKVFGLETIGLIRGYEAYRNNPTLKLASENGMEIRFFDKQEFLEIESEYLSKLKEEIGEFGFVPLGGGNILGMQGCAEIPNEMKGATTHICTACGTGSTMAGIVSGASEGQKIIGFPAMKNGKFMKEDIEQHLLGYRALAQSSFEIITDYHFGGFAKMNPALIEFIQRFKLDHGIALDGVYNGKMMFGLYDLIRNDHFERGSVITAIHTGGVQGNAGLATKYKTDLPLN